MFKFSFIGTTCNNWILFFYRKDLYSATWFGHSYCSRETL